MADNIDITPGAGKTVLTDDCTTGHAQIVKLAIASNGVATLIPADATYGLSVDVARLTTLPAGTNAIGKLAANTGVDIGDVDVTSVVPGTGATNLGKAVDAVAGATDTGTAILAIRDDALATLTPIDGDYTNLRTNSQGALWVAISGSLTSAGDVAHDTGDSGNPVKIGAKAKASTKGLTLVAADDRTDMIADLDGLQIVKIGTSNADLKCDRVADTGGSSTAFTSFTGVASTYNYVTALTVFNSSAAAAYVDFRDGTGGAVLYTVFVPAGGGVVITNGGSPIFRTSANTALAYDVSAATTTMYINATGYQSKA